MQIGPATGKGDPSVIRIKVTVPYEDEKKEVLATAKKMFAIRYGIPFDTWFWNYIDAPKIIPSMEVIPYFTQENLQRKPCSARLWAAWALTESVIRTTIESATYVMRRILFKEKSEKIWRNLQAQVSSIILSGTAIISPDLAKDCFLEYWERQDVRETFKNEWKTKYFEYNPVSHHVSYI
jgi:hypothetical protein